MKRKYIALAALAFALVLGMTIAPASAYFTDQHTANGTVPIKVGPSTDINEWVKDKTKGVVVTNDDGAAPVFVRVQSEYPSVLGETVEFENDADWKLVDGWYVYQDEVPGGGSTSEIRFTYTFPTVESENPPTDGDNYNIVITYEAVPAKYNADGTPDYNNWVDTWDQN